MLEEVSTQRSKSLVISAPSTTPSSEDEEAQPRIKESCKRTKAPSKVAMKYPWSARQYEKSTFKLSLRCIFFECWLYNPIFLIWEVAASRFPRIPPLNTQKQSPPTELIRKGDLLDSLGHDSALILQKYIKSFYE